MKKIFEAKDRQEVFDFILSISKENTGIVSLVQVGSGAYGYHDEKSDLDFVIALDTDSSMSEVMDYMRDKISSQYEIQYCKKAEASHLLVIVLSNLLEIDMGFGGYEYAAARKPEYKVIYDNTGVVEDKMNKSREWMDDSIYGNKQQKDIEAACDSVWARMMHAAVAIYRNNFLRAIGELDYIRRVYVDLLGDRYRLESGCNHDMDKLPDEAKNDIRSTLVYSEDTKDLWMSLSNLTTLVYKELEGNEIPISKEMLFEYYKDMGLKL
ncbi:MAG: hypothetical protein MJ119_07595 [Lachnospiraceae bacterium]|nr:hypothetical protein [Lachnospiraceae bacterium]